jgi:hypothetical protein
VSAPLVGETKRPFVPDNHEHSLPSTVTVDSEISPIKLDSFAELTSFAVQDDGKSKFNF